MAPKLNTSRFKTVTLDHRKKQFERLIDLVTKHNDPERRDALLKMYDDLMERVISAPAATKVYFHCAYEGGYLDHILNVIESSVAVTKLYKQMGGTVDYSAKELVFAAMHHDLGKLGDLAGPRYVPETENYWNERGQTFKHVEEDTFISVTDKSLLLLSQYGIKISDKELIGIRMANGLFDDAAKEYFMAWGIFPHKTSIGYVIHWADWISSRAEADEQRELLNKG